MLAWRISQSRRVNELSGWGPMLLYTWLIPHLDNLGRCHGEPVQVKASVFPRREDVSVELLSEWLKELDRSGLMVWYEVDGMRFLSMPEKVWCREQRLHKNLSQHSDLPSYYGHHTEVVRMAYGDRTEIVPTEVEVEFESEVELESEGKEKLKANGKESAESKPQSQPRSHANLNVNGYPPSFWNSPAVQSRLQEARLVGYSDAEARELIVAETRAKELNA